MGGTQGPPAPGGAGAQPNTEKNIFPGVLSPLREALTQGGVGVGRGEVAGGDGQTLSSPPTHSSQFAKSSLGKLILMA